ncbi:MAG: thioredoxin family protein [Bacteroidota bacterium]
METVLRQSLKKGISYAAYRRLVNKLASEKGTSGKVQTASLINYTQLNDRRMNRWDKTFKIAQEVQDKLSRLAINMTWLVLTESWCGDASPSLPVIHKIAELVPGLELKIVFRDENPALMDLFLTNETRSIPKLIALRTDTLSVLGEWGPRSSTATKMVDDYKRLHGKLTPEFKQDLQVWYNKDKGADILEDLLQLLALE